MDTAGKAVLLSGLTVLVSLSAVLLVPAPARAHHGRRHHAGRHVRSDRHHDTSSGHAGALGPKVNAASLPYAKRQQHRSPKFAAWGELLHKYPWPFALVSVGILVALALPVLGLKVAMPSIAVVPDDAPRSARLRVGSGPVR